MPYFDHNATTPLSPSARAQWLQAADESWQNPSSPYRAGARVRNRLEEARATLAGMLGCSPPMVVFTSGGTEGVNTLFQYCASRKDLADRPALISPIEHSCVIESAERYFPGKTSKLPLSASGEIEVFAIVEIIRKQRPALLSLMAANNETGALQPWLEISRACRQAGILFHCDAAQWAGKLPLNGLGSCGFVTASAHKFGGPKGIGFLVVPPEADGFRGQAGGKQEHGMRAGTENYAAVAAMLAALEEAERFAIQEEKSRDREHWRDEFEREAVRRLPGCRIVIHGSGRLWNTVTLILPYGDNIRWARKLDRYGFQVATGSACATGKEGASHVLQALGFSPEETRRAIRISSGWQTSRTEWIDLLNALESVFRELEGDGNRSGLAEVVRL